jgi:hypothetical protein
LMHLGMVVSPLLMLSALAKGLPLVEVRILILLFDSYQGMCSWCLICDQMRVSLKLALPVK